MWLTPDDAPVALLRVGSGGAATEANRAWCELTGLSVEESRGEGWLGFLDLAARASVLDTVLVAAGSDHPVCLELSGGGAAPLRLLARRSEDGADVVLAVIPAVVGSAGDGLAPEDSGPDVVDVIRELYAVSLGLASCLNLVDGRAGHRISSAIDRLDRVIWRLRSTVVEHRRRAGSAPAGDALVARPGSAALLRDAHRPSVPHVPAQRRG